MKRSASLRGIAWNIGIAVLCAAIPAAIAHVALPSSSEIAAMRVHRDALALDLARLERRGAKVDWRNCGEEARLCVRIDRNAPSYGAKGDYLILNGY